MKFRAALMTACAVAMCGAPAFAWGMKGHTIINETAAAGFPGRLPAFLTTRAAAFEIAYLGPEPDRLKGSGNSWDSDYDPGHYVNLLDDGTIAGVVQLAHLPADREQYDAALRAANTDQYKQGYLPYSLLDGWEQLRMDFAYWRVDDYAAAHDSSAAVRAQEKEIRTIDEQQILADLGMWGHYVGDACQPLHATVHFNGWGNYPNPKGYANARNTHSFFESEFVNKFITPAMVSAAVRGTSSLPQPQTLLTQDDVMAYIAAYLQATASTVPQLYDIEKAGGFTNGSQEAKTFTAARLAAGAMELRDLSVLAWQDSEHARVGYPAASVHDILSGKAPWPAGPGD